MDLDGPVTGAAIAEWAQSGLLWVGLACYGAALLVASVRPKVAVWPLRLGVVLHLFAMTARGWAIGFFPLTNKMESFSAAALAVAIVATFNWREARGYCIPLLAVTFAALTAALAFSTDLTYPPPLMQTLWYPLHVPLSFFAYGVWTASAAAGIAWVRHRDPVWVMQVDRFALHGFGLWSVSMICGGVWGVLAWGAYFLWDVKILWSVILWFHYAMFLHLRLAPPPWNHAWVRVVLALVGFVWVFVAYVGTSFLFGRSSHAF